MSRERPNRLTQEAGLHNIVPASMPDAAKFQGPEAKQDGPGPNVAAVQGNGTQVIGELSDEAGFDRRGGGQQRHPGLPPGARQALADPSAA